MVATGPLPASRPALIALALAAVGLVVVMVGVPWGIGPLVAGWVGLALTDRRWLTLALVAATPLVTFGWTAEIAQIAGRTLDVRLVVTFAVAAIASAAVLPWRGRPSWLELLFLCLVGWAGISGLLAADSVLTWAPPAARLAAYAATFGLARRYLTRPGDLHLVAAVFAVAFAIPTAAGLVVYVAGDADFLNEAVRGSTPGGRGPISLAFAGQVAMALGLALFSVSRPSSAARPWWLVTALVGAGGLLASATRLVTVTAWLILGGFAAIRRQWRTAAVITLLFAASFVLRPELLGRFLGTVGEPEPSPSQEVDPDELEVDASFRFRLFVWSAILGEWTEHPLTGIGPGMTAHVVAERSAAERAAPHNDYVGIFAEMSVVGLALYVGIQFLVLRGLALRARDARDERGRDLILMTALLFIGTNVLGALNNPIYFFDMQIGLWALVGAALSLPTTETGAAARRWR